MYGHDERPGDDLADRNTGRHRGNRLSAPVALGLTVVALLGAFGIGAALLPDSVTGSGVQNQARAASVDGPVGVAGGLPGTDAPVAPPSADPASPAAPSADPAAPSVSPSPDAPPSPAAPKASTPPAPAPEKPKPKPKPPSKPSKPTKPATVPSDQESQENEVVRLTNVERGKAGCGPVTMNSQLRTAMRLHVAELGTHGNLYISHDSDDGRDFSTRARQQGYNAAAGENVARGQSDAADVMESWMNSPGHRSNLLNCSHKAIGVGMVKGVDNTLVWGQIFGRS